MRTIQLKILEIAEAKLNRNETSGGKFPKILYLTRLSSFQKKLENVVHVPFATNSLLEVAENSNPPFFWLNGNRPVFTS